METTKVFDNFDDLTKIITFPSSEIYYVISIIARKKDFPEDAPEFKERKHKEHFIKHYFITSLERFNKLKPKIIESCRLHHARAYLGLDGKNIRKTLALHTQLFAEMLASSTLGENEITRYNKSFHSICRIEDSSEPSLRCIHLDLDITPDSVDTSSLVDELKNLLLEHHWLFTILTTPNGYHFVGRIRRKSDPNYVSINLQELGNVLVEFREKHNLKENDLEMKKNSMALLYMVKQDYT